MILCRASTALIKEKIHIRAVVDVARIRRGEGGLKLFCALGANYSLG